MYHRVYFRREAGVTSLYREKWVRLRPRPVPAQRKLTDPRVDSSPKVDWSRRLSDSAGLFAEVLTDSARLLLFVEEERGLVLRVCVRECL